MATTDDPNDPRLTHGTDDHPVPQAGVYLVLSEEERAKGFQRPVYRAYIHNQNAPGSTACNVITTMSRALAETYAADPNFYSNTFCSGCARHLPVNLFTWVEQDGSPVEGEHARVGS